MLLVAVPAEQSQGRGNGGGEEEYEDRCRDMTARECGRARTNGTWRSRRSITGPISRSRSCNDPGIAAPDGRRLGRSRARQSSTATKATSAPNISAITDTRPFARRVFTAQPAPPTLQAPTPTRTPARAAGPSPESRHGGRWSDRHREEGADREGVHPGWRQQVHRLGRKLGHPPTGAQGEGCGDHAQLASPGAGERTGEPRAATRQVELLLHCQRPEPPRAELGRPRDPSRPSGR